MTTTIAGAMQGFTCALVLPPFSSCMQVGDTWQVPLMVNASGEYVQGADVELRFDASVIQARACRAGEHAINRQGFECRFNIASSLDSVQVSYVDNDVGQDWNTSAEGPLFELATIEFEVCIH